jgi:hypothetical protein
VNAGPPLLKHCEREFWWADVPDLAALQLYRREVIDVESITPQPAPAAVFSVDKLLGRERSGSSTPAPSYWWILLLNGLALFLIGAYLMRRSGTGGDTGGSQTSPVQPPQSGES